MVARAPMIDVSGVRSSWLTTDTKSDFILANSSMRREVSAASWNRSSWARTSVAGAARDVNTSRSFW